MKLIHLYVGKPDPIAHVRCNCGRLLIVVVTAFSIKCPRCGNGRAMRHVVPPGTLAIPLKSLKRRWRSRQESNPHRSV